MKCCDMKLFKQLVVLSSCDFQAERAKITKSADFENQNHYKTVILKIKILTNSELLNSKSSYFENNF